jgi:undecaprenyl diphosphate synthase
MAESSEMTTVVISNLIKAKKFRNSLITRFKSRSKFEPLGARQNVWNKLGTLNGKAPVSTSLIKQELESSDFPSHIALTPDGNRRWAKARDLTVGEGYAAGAEQIKTFRRLSFNNPVDTVSVFLLSTENIARRPQGELQQLYGVFSNFFNSIADNKFVHDNRISHEVRGNEEAIDMLPDNVLDAIDKMEEATEDYDENKMVFLVGYSGRDEIINAARNIPRGQSEIEITGEGEDETEFRDQLLLGDLSDVDMLIRTSERRISNFMLYENAYSELVFMDKFWPDYTPADFFQNIYTYANRDRRYGV